MPWRRHVSAAERAHHGGVSLEQNQIARRPAGRGRHRHSCACHAGDLFEPDVDFRIADPGEGRVRWRQISIYRSCCAGDFDRMAGDASGVHDALRPQMLRAGEHRGGRAAGVGISQGHAPDYWDFLYVATSIGATSQTSDVASTSKELRRIVTVHAVLSFFFNTMVLALSINLAASLA